MLGYNIEYNISLEKARETAKREIAKVAARVTDDKGLPLYGLVKSYRNDTFIVDGFIGDSLSQVLTRFPDVCRLEREGGSYTLSFNLPDFDYNMSDIAEDELNRFIGQQVTALWLATRYNAFAQFYTEQASASMERLVVILRTRKTPER